MLGMRCYLVNAPVVDLRESPSQAAKVVSQAIFGEQVLCQEIQGHWARIETPDGYQGWAAANTWVEAHESSTFERVSVSRLMAHLYARPDVEYGPLKTVPYEAKFRLLERIDDRWAKVALPDGSLAYIQNGDLALELSICEKSDLISFSQKFLGLPYTWGGRSSFGYDCSGFVQMLYGKLGAPLPRDSKDQAKDPRLVTAPLEALEPGDLIFWGRTPEKIGHVGMFLGQDAFIHTSTREVMPYLRISRLSDPEWSGKESCYYPCRFGRRLLLAAASLRPFSSKAFR
jgi:hypothetical protein